ncbi:hypothetical protein [Sulfurimonas microaerophilic]|uniref:HvfA family oxazolone/thioamide-modified RiPP metallophore n=1 Tax=Sulfurimonas microaerophilic TaxID=3058392 RepID=UPI002714E485|nr:hypothetical protein [Sulfurimonas sp. hsl 1-7]
MKRLGLMSLIASAMLFVAFGATTLSAENGMGKCGNGNNMMDNDDRRMMEKREMKRDGKCGNGKGMMYDDDRGMMDNREMKRDGKCGAKKKEPKKYMKCGAGKCGS